MAENLPTVRLGDVLSLSDRAIASSELSEVNLAGVYSFGRGLFKRGPMRPAETSYKSYNRLVQDDFVISEPKAWEGALARVTGEFEGWFLSPVFPTFIANTDRLLPAYLEWFCKRKSVWQDLQMLSKGMGARRETVSPEQFLSLGIPLPPLNEQRRVVARIEQLAAKVEEARRISADSNRASHALSASVLDRLLPKSAPEKPLSDLVMSETSISYGVLVPGPDTPGGVPFVRVQDLSIKGAAEVPNKRISSDVAAQYKRTTLSGGEVLIAVVGSIGKIGIAPQSWAGANIARAVCRIIPASDVDARFLAETLSDRRCQDYFREQTRTLAQPTLNIGQLETTPIKLPPLGEQRRIVAELDAVQAKVDAVKALQAETSAELDALIPAILDKAFKGEL